MLGPLPSGISLAVAGKVAAVEADYPAYYAERRLEVDMRNPAGLKVGTYNPAGLEEDTRNPAGLEEGMRNPAGLEEDMRNLAGLEEDSMVAESDTSGRRLAGSHFRG